MLHIGRAASAKVSPLKGTFLKLLVVNEYDRRRLQECDVNIADSFSETFTLLPKVADPSVGEPCVSIS